MIAFFKGAPTLAYPFTFLLLAVPILFFTDHRDLADALGTFGTPVILLANVFYIVFFHSRRRWKGLSAAERAGKLFTFQR